MTTLLVYLALLIYLAPESTWLETEQVNQYNISGFTYNWLYKSDYLNVFKLGEVEVNKMFFIGSLLCSTVDKLEK